MDFDKNACSPDRASVLLHDLNKENQSGMNVFSRFARELARRPPLLYKPLGRSRLRSPPVISRAIWTLAVLAVVPHARAAELEVTGIQVVHRHGQTFVTWKDVAEGE